MNPNVKLPMTNICVLDWSGFVPLLTPVANTVILPRSLVRTTILLSYSLWRLLDSTIPCNVTSSLNCISTSITNLT